MKKLLSTKLHLLWSAALIFVFGSISLYSEVLDPPILDNVTTNGQILSVRFSIKPVDNIDSVQLFWAVGETNNFEDFQWLNTVMVDIRKDSSNQGDYVTYQYNYKLLDFLRPGAYTFCLKAIYHEDISGPSNFFVLKYSYPKEIRFTTNPETEIHPNNEYIYYSHAYSIYDSSLAVRYKVIKGETAIIDEVTGKFTWTPESYGEHEFIIRAYLLDDETVYAEQAWTVHVFECEYSSIISAEVKDELGNPIKYGGYILYKESNGKDTTIGLYFRGGEFTGEGSFYVTNLDKGTYYLMVFGFNNEFESEYYKDAYTMADATPIVLNCSDTAYIAIEVKRIKTSSDIEVSGSVLKARDNTPVYPGIVTFFGADSLGRTWASQAFTGSDGKYWIKLKNNLTYIARADAVFDTTSQEDLGLLSIYYDNVQDITEAKEIKFDDSTNYLNVINFLLPDRPNYDNSISGIVTDDSTKLAIPNATVIAYLIETISSNKDHLFYGRTTTSDENGKFEFTNLIPGKYVILAYTEGREYIPGYYKEGQLSVLSWWDGTRITVKETSIISDIDIRLENIFYLNSQGGVNGRITKGDGGYTMKIHNSPQGTEPVVGAIVYALDNANKVRNYGFSDINGNFEVNKLYKGQFTIQYDKVGYLKASEKVTVSGSGIDKKDATLIPTNTTPVEEPVIKSSEFQVYPIPAVKELNVCFTGKLGTANILLVNTLGQNVFKEQINSITGMNTFKMMTMNLLPGLYMLRIENNVNNYSMPVIIE